MPKKSTPQGWSGVLTRWENYQRAKGLQDETIKTRLGVLRRYARAMDCPPDFTTVEKYINYTAARDFKGDSRRLYAVSIKLFYEWYNETYNKDVETVKIPIPRKRKGKPRPASVEEIKTALEKAGEREKLIILLAAELGLRRGEIARLHTRDIIDGKLLRVCGKGGKIRIIPVPAKIVRMLTRRGTGWVFPSNYSCTSGHLCPKSISIAVRPFLPDGVRLHDLRHSFATRVYNSGADLLSVQQFLGHASPETTLNYILTAEDRLRVCMELGKIA